MTTKNHSNTELSAGSIVGVDVGGTKTHAVAFDHNYNELGAYRTSTRTGGVEPVVETVLEAVQELTAGLHPRTPSVIGVGIPGLVDPVRGQVRQAVNLGIGDEPLDIAEHLATTYGVPCYIDNDVNVAALGAHELLRGEREVSDLAYLSIGTGIAAGVILNGQLHRGHRGVAGEIGHFPMVPNGPACQCGLHGCLEAVASGSAFSRQWPATAGVDSAEALISEAKAGNPRAIAVLDPIADHLANAVYLLALTYDIDCVVIGGGVADLGQPLLDTIHTGLRRLAARSRFIASLDLVDRVVLKPPRAVGALGAAVLTQMQRSA